MTSARVGELGRRGMPNAKLSHVHVHGHVHGVWGIYARAPQSLALKYKTDSVAVDTQVQIPQISDELYLLSLTWLRFEQLIELDDEL